MAPLAARPLSLSELGSVEEVRVVAARMLALPRDFRSLLKTLNTRDVRQEGDGFERQEGAGFESHALELSLQTLAEMLQNMGPRFSQLMGERPAHGAAVDAPQLVDHRERAYPGRVLLVDRHEERGAVPLLDMLRFNQLLAGASWMGEYGDPSDPDEGGFLRSISPYHNVDANGDYPEIYLYTSTKDDRVHPGHARKLAYLLNEMDQDEDGTYVARNWTPVEISLVSVPSDPTVGIG